MLGSWGPRTPENEEAMQGPDSLKLLFFLQKVKSERPQRRILEKSHMKQVNTEVEKMEKGKPSIQDLTVSSLRWLAGTVLCAWNVLPQIYTSQPLSLFMP